MPAPDTRQEQLAKSFHDFSGKLSSHPLHKMVSAYIRWQRGECSKEEWLDIAAPMSINLDLTTACNYACDHCIDWDSLNSPIRHDSVALRESLSELARRGMRSVILIGGGEPTLHPEFVQMVKFLKTDLKQQVAIVSNGSRNDIIAQAVPFLDEGDWVRLSLDSGREETFRLMHKPKKEITLREICESAGRLKEMNPKITLGFSFVITWLGSCRDETAVVPNLEEMEEASYLAATCGFDYISFKPFLNRTAEGAEVLNAEQAQRQQQAMETIANGLEKSKKAKIKVLESLNLKVLLDGTWRQWTAQPSQCHMQAFRQVISPLGVFNCPGHRGVSKARIGESSAWVSVAGELPSAVISTAEILSTFDASCECSEVTCLYNPTNHFIQKLIDEGGELPISEDAPGLDTFL